MADVNATLELTVDPFKELDKLKAGKRNSILRKALRAGAKPVRNAAKSGATKRTGALKSSISTKVATSKKGEDQVYAVTGPRRKFTKSKKFGKKTIVVTPTKYARLVEGGTKPHSIRKGDRLGKGKKQARQTGKKHPGAKAKPFLKPAFASTQSSFTTEMLRVIQDELKKLWNKKPKKK